METVYLLILCVYGVVWGSFLTVVGLRVPLNQPITVSRSACPNCHRILSAKELIPVFSFLHQKGKCRNCGQQISLIYPIIELVSAAAFCLIYVTSNDQLFQIISPGLLLTFGIIFSVSDLTYQILPDRIMRWFATTVFAAHLFNDMQDFLLYSASGIIFFLLFYLFYRIFPDSIGGGDVKCYAVLGFLLGYQTCVLGLLLACLLVFAVYLPLLLAKKITSQRVIPFAPFIFTGAFMAYFIGPAFYEWLNLLLYIT